MEQHDVVVIGAGPAGLFCALHAALPSHRVLLLEKNPDPGASSSSPDPGNAILPMAAKFVISFLIMVITENR